MRYLLWLISLCYETTRNLTNIYLMIYCSRTMVHWLNFYDLPVMDSVIKLNMQYVATWIKPFKINDIITFIM